MLIGFVDCSSRNRIAWLWYLKLFSHFEFLGITRWKCLLSSILLKSWTISPFWSGIGTGSHCCVWRRQSVRTADWYIGIQRLSHCFCEWIISNHQTSFWTGLCYRIWLLWGCRWDTCLQAFYLATPSPKSTNSSYWYYRWLVL